MAGHPVRMHELRSSSAARRRALPDDQDAGLTGTPVALQLTSLQRLAGNQAVARLLAGAEERPVPVVQRWAWVAGARVLPGGGGQTPAMTAFASDTVVRDYVSSAEFKDHAAGKTDYLGNLPAASGSPGTWVRFNPTGTNVLGEDHTLVKLEQVTPAVRSTSFIAERLATDDLSARPAMRAAYEAENQGTFATYGITNLPNKQLFGGESMFPKLAYAFNSMLPYVCGMEPMIDLKPGNYDGQPYQRYLKIGWGHATDVADEVATLVAAKQTVPAHLRRLAAAFTATRGELDSFIKALPVDGYLGDALDTAAGRRKLRSLERFCRALIGTMTALMKTDTSLTGAERRSLTRMPRGSRAERDTAFMRWRDLHFAKTLRDAVNRGVRYAGMGRAHMRFLVADGLPPNTRAFDMVERDLRAFEDLTTLRAASVKAP